MTLDMPKSAIATNINMPLTGVVPLIMANEIFSPKTVMRNPTIIIRITSKIPNRLISCVYLCVLNDCAVGRLVRLLVLRLSQLLITTLVVSTVPPNLPLLAHCYVRRQTIRVLI